VVGERLAAGLVQRFRDLVRQWKEATTFTSSGTEIALHPAYQQIIGMGKEAIPLILEELQRKEDHWFWARKSITGADPVPPGECGSLPKKTATWLPGLGHVFESDQKSRIVFFGQHPGQILGGIFRVRQSLKQIDFVIFKFHVKRSMELSGGYSLSCRKHRYRESLAPATTGR